MASGMAFGQDTLVFKSGTVTNVLIASYSNGIFSVLVDSEMKQAPARGIDSIVFGPRDPASAPATQPAPVLLSAKKLSLQKGLTPEQRKENKELGVQFMAVAVAVNSPVADQLEVKHDYFRLRDKDGIEYTPSTWGLDMLQEIAATTLRSGESVGGWVGFSVPSTTDFNLLMIRYQNEDIRSDWVDVPRLR